MNLFALLYPLFQSFLSRPSLRRLATKVLVPCKAHQPHAGEGSHTLIFLQCCQRRQTQTAPQTETTFRWPPSRLWIAACWRRL